jgi:amidase
MLRALRARTISAVELLDLHLRRIERYDPAINSIILKDLDRARRDAASADAKRAAGEDAPLLGLPMTIKESIDVQGLPSTAGITDRREHRAPADALTVRRLRDAGAIIVGKTNVCVWLNDYQGDNPLYGRTINPWNPDRTSGGSTAGSAALAAGLIPLELGSDLGGSMRVPAAFCGLVGHKPSEPLVPNSGHFPGSPLPNAAFCMSAQGPHARSAADVRLALDVIKGPEIGLETAWRIQVPAPRHSRLKDFRVAILPPLDWMPVDPDITAALDNLASKLSSLGCTVTTLQPPGLGELRDYYAAFRTMMWTLISMRWPAAHRDQVIADKLSRDDVYHHADARGVRLSAGDYLLLHERREQYRAAYRDFFRDHDVLLTPVTLVNAFPHMRGPNADRRFTIAGREVEFDYLSFYPSLATLTGQPATAFPAGFSREGLPIGLQAIGPYLEDHTPLHFAELLEHAFGGFVPPPAYPA